MSVPSIYSRQEGVRLFGYRWLLLIFWVALPLIYFFRSLLLLESITLVRDLLAVPLIMITALTLIKRKLSVDLWLFYTYSVLVLGTIIFLSWVGYQQSLLTSLRLARILAVSPLFLILAQLLQEQEKIITLIKGMIVIGIISTLYGLKQEFFGYAPFEHQFISSSIAYSRVPTLFFRIFSIWGTPTVFAAYLLCTFWCFIGVNGFLFEKSRWSVVWKFLIGVTLLLGMLVSRMTIFVVAFIISVLVFLLLIAKQKLRLPLSLLSLFIMIAIVLFGTATLSDFTFSHIQVYLSDLQVYDVVRVRDSLSIRLDVWRSWLDTIGLHPFGLGLGVLETTDISTPDNSFVDILIRSGWVGLLLYIFLLIRVVLLPNVSRSFESSSYAGKVFWSAIVAMVVASIIAGMTSSVFINSVYAPYFWLLSGLAHTTLTFGEHSEYPTPA